MDIKLFLLRFYCGSTEQDMKAYSVKFNLPEEIPADEK